MSRREQLAGSLAVLEQRLVAVTKTRPASDVELLRDLGVLDVGENRDQEAREKAAAVPGVRWHFVGGLQTNKARSVASYASVVHSVDRTALVDALSAGAERAGRALDVLLQVSLDGDPSRGGALRADVPQLAESTVAAPGLRLAGVMAVAPLGVEPARAFAELAAVAGDLRQAHPGAAWISAGMSGDLEQAIAAGATHVRVGTALLGERPPPSR